MASIFGFFAETLQQLFFKHQPAFRYCSGFIHELIHFVGKTASLFRDAVFCVFVINSFSS
jgi:hypothetical protein